MRHTRRLFTLLVFIPLAIRPKVPPSASITIEIDVSGSEHNVRNPIVNVTFKNLFASPLQIGSAGAFFDYQFQLTHAEGHRVPMTKEGLDIRNGNGAIVMSAMVLTLKPNESQQENLDLARYFDLSVGGPYRLVLVRVLDRSGERITSNSLLIPSK